MDIHITVTPSTKTRSFSQETKRLIEEGWSFLSHTRENIFNARLLRVTQTHFDKTVRIHAVPDVTYKDVVGLRYHAAFLNHIPQEDVFQALSALAIVETADKKIILLERDSGDWEHSLELPGGFFRADDRDAHSFILKRVAADLSLDTSDVESVHYMRVIDYKDICEFVLVFSARIALTFEALVASTQKHIVALPTEYTAHRHTSFFKLPLHSPSKTVLEKLYETDGIGIINKT